MDCEYWKEIVGKLWDTGECWRATHILKTMLPCGDELNNLKLSKNNLDETNLGIALKCVSEDKIIEGTIYAYRDWDSQPSCDLILAQFDREKTKRIFCLIESPTEEMRLGVESFLEDMNS
jgi:hypothetical protein